MNHQTPDTEPRSTLTAWERVEIARHPNRPKSSDYIQRSFDAFVELHGDRAFADDAALLGGLGRIEGRSCVVLGQEKGRDTHSRLKRNFGMLQPEGYRKALRLMKLGEKFGLPVICLIDTPGAHPGLEAEERGQGWAIAQNLKEMAQLKVPIISLIIGEGCSGGALGIGLADTVAMLQHSYYSVISPEGCASILWRTDSAKQQAAERLQLTSERLLALGVVDTILQEPPLGAHLDPRQLFADVRGFLTAQLESLSRLAVDELLDRRYGKFRHLGVFTSELQLTSS